MLFLYHQRQRDDSHLSKKSVEALRLLVPINSLQHLKLLKSMDYPMAKAQWSDDRNRRLALNRAAIVTTKAMPLLSIGVRRLNHLIIPSVRMN